MTVKRVYTETPVHSSALRRTDWPVVTGGACRDQAEAIP
jgi:hypothetical protein